MTKILKATQFNNSFFHQAIGALTDNELTSLLQQTYGQLTGLDAGFLFFSPDIGDDYSFEVKLFHKRQSVVLRPDKLLQCRESICRFNTIVDETVKDKDIAQLASFSIAARLLEMYPGIDSVQCAYYQQALPALTNDIRPSRNQLYQFGFSR